MYSAASPHKPIITISHQPSRVRYYLTKKGVAERPPSLLFFVLVVLCTCCSSSPLPTSSGYTEDQTKTCPKS